MTSLDRLPTLLLLLSLIATGQYCTAAEKALDVELEELRPGLVATYHSIAEANANLTRIDGKPAFTLGNSSPHPRLPVGPFEATWKGVVLLKDNGPLTFHAFVCGELTVQVGGVIVLKGQGRSETAEVGPAQPLNLETGTYRIEIRYRSLSEVPARLQLWWAGPTFAEPLPPWQLFHVAKDVTPELRQEELADKGRGAAEHLGCARCHASAFPGVEVTLPGPSLVSAGRRLGRDWLMNWLDDPARVRSGAHMPRLFTDDLNGFVERWLVTEHLLASPGKVDPAKSSGDHRLGRRMFVGLGCAACHFLPDVERTAQPDHGRTPLTALKDRFTASELAAFLVDPHARYPDGRMPRLPLTPEVAANIAAFLLEWSKSTEPPLVKPPPADEIDRVMRRLGVRDPVSAGRILVGEKRCAVCHSGLEKMDAADIPLTVKSEGCLSGRSLPRYTLDESTRTAIGAYRKLAASEKHASPFHTRQRLIHRLGCVRCHQRDTSLPPVIEAVGSTLGGAWLQNVPFQRAPRLTHPHQKYTRTHLLTAVRDGVAGLRHERFTYRMPKFGAEAETIVRALAEADGEMVDGKDLPQPPPADPTLGSLAGPSLVGFQGYACVSCHLWNGKALSEPDPGAVGTELTRLNGRIRRDWFDRYLEGPARAHPNTPMPAIFQHGKPAMLASVLNGDVAKQKEALWHYFALGKDAPSPKPPPPMPVPSPETGEPLVAQIPVRVPDGTILESLCVLYSEGDLLVYDLGAAARHSAYTGARILRGVQGRLRTFTVDGAPLGNGLAVDPPLRLIGRGKPETAESQTLHGFDRLADGARVRRQLRFASGTLEVVETLRRTTDGGKRRFLRELKVTGIPSGYSVEGTAPVTWELPPPKKPASFERTVLPDPGVLTGSLERPGYRAIAYPRPKTVSGEDRVMPGAVAVDPRSGQVFVASMKTGEILTLHDPTGDGKRARFDNYGGLVEEAFSMLAEPGELYVLHRRNLTRITDTDRDGRADRFDRVTALDHSIADKYDYAYGLARDRKGAFVYTYAPHANQQLTGSGSALHLVPGKKPEVSAFGFRNPLGWCSGPDGEVFFTDNQGEWVATNKLCHVVEGRFYGYPNPGQREHAKKPAGRTAVWVPYAWAKSINGVAYDNTDGKFGPFAGQLFMAELMFGGAIVRANVEKVNGEYQGACFPFWGPGLLGPVTLAFDPKGHLYVGGITEPGWMAQPDRGALFRIDWTGKTPFEMQSIHVRPRGFRIVFTEAVDPKTLRDILVEHYRYEHTGAYGSPELDRTRVAVERVDLAEDGRSVDLTLPLVKERVYFIQPHGVRSIRGEPALHPAGAYTLNEIPRDPAR